jgi:hypothetical protein
VGLTRKDRISLLRSVWLFERCNREIAALDHANGTEVPAKTFWPGRASRT